MITLRRLTHPGFVTKPQNQEPESALLAQEIDQNFLELEQHAPQFGDMIVGDDDQFPGPPRWSGGNPSLELRPQDWTVLPSLPPLPVSGQVTAVSVSGSYFNNYFVAVGLSNVASGESLHVYSLTDSVFVTLPAIGGDDVRDLKFVGDYLYVATAGGMVVLNAPAWTLFTHGMTVTSPTCFKLAVVGLWYLYVGSDTPPYLTAYYMPDLDTEVAGLPTLPGPCTDIIEVPGGSQIVAAYDGGLLAFDAAVGFDVDAGLTYAQPAGECRLDNDSSRLLVAGGGKLAVLSLSTWALEHELDIPSGLAVAVMQQGQALAFTSTSPFYAMYDAVTGVQWDFPFTLAEQVLAFERLNNDTSQGVMGLTGGAVDRVRTYYRLNTTYYIRETNTSNIVYEFYVNTDRGLD